MSVLARSGTSGLSEKVLDSIWRGAGVIAVLGRRSDALEAWGRAFARAARARRGVSLEIYMPSTREALIERFNQALAGLSLERAREPASDEQGQRIILVPDARAFDSPEGLLLARLISDFPGAATRLVLLVDHDDPTATERLMTGLGRAVQRIEIDPLVNIQPPRNVTAAPMGEASDSVSDPNQASGGVRERAAESPAPRSLSIPIEGLPEASRRTSVNWLGVGALVMALLLISALIVVLLHREPVSSAPAERRSAPQSSTPLVRSADGLQVATHYSQSGV